MTALRHTHQSYKWTTLTSLQAKYPRYNPVCIGKSIWISTRYNEGECGMIEIDCETNAIKQAVPYPNDFQPWAHSACGSNEYGIVIVDGENGKLIEFNPQTNKFGKVVAIPKLGVHPSPVMINQNVHIIHGYNNTENQYLIYSMKTKKVKEFKENLKTPAMCYVAITKTDDGQFVKFGGIQWMGYASGMISVGTLLTGSGIAAFESVDSLYIASLDDGNTEKPISWRKAPSCKLQEPLHQCGVIQRGPYIAVFGGCGGYANSKNEMDDIYILDTRSKRGWSRSPIKCPMKSKYVAVLDYQHKVHLCTYDNNNKQHYSIALKDIIPEITISPIPQQVSMKGAQQNDDEKGGFEVDDRAKLRETNATLKAMVDSLKDEVERLKQENVVLIEKGKESTKKVMSLEKANADLLENQRGMGSDDMESNEINEQNVVIESLKVEVNRLRNENGAYQDQQKGYEQKIAVLEKKVKKLEFETLDLSNYMEWNGNQILFWMMSLDDGRFEKYGEMLKSALSENDVIGEDLSDITALTLKAWGMTDRKDAKGLSGFIHELIQQNGPHGAVMMNVAAAAAPKENEGAPTAFIGR